MEQSILDVVHESAKGLHDAGFMDDMTMREFDALCLLDNTNKTQFDECLENAKKNG